MVMSVGVVMWVWLFLQKDVVDGIDTVKFAYIQFVGEEVKPMAKAKVSTHKGALENHFKVISRSGHPVPSTSSG